MNYKVASIPLFDKQAKRLAKKYPSIKNDLTALITILIAIAYKNKGKSGGARVITFVKVVAATVYLSSIYDKGEKGTISDKELQQVFKLIP